MHRIDNITAAPSLPAVLPAGVPGFWTEGNPLGGPGPTVMDQDWFNAVQEELLALMAAAGINPAKGTYTQVRDAVKRIGAGNSSSFAASTSLSPDHAGVVFISAAGGNVVLTMPEADAAGGVAMRFTFVRTDGSGNTVTIQRAAGDLIEGAATYAIPVNGRVTLVGSGGAAWVVQSYLPFPAPYVPPAPWAAPAYIASSSGFLQLSGNRPGDAGFYLAWGMAGGADDVPGSGTSFPSASFAFAFPSACLQVVGTLADSGAGAGVLVSSTFSNSGVTFSVSEYTTAVQALGVRYFAIGC